MILTRTLSVLAAALLVLAFTLASILPPFTSLGEVIANYDHALLLWLRATFEARFPGWLWTQIVVPLLLRPVWLLPLSFGLVFVGLSVTMASRNKKGKGLARSRRRS